MNLRIDDMIAPIGGASQTISTPAIKDAVADAASGGGWFNQTPWKVIRKGVKGITPGNVFNAVSVEHSFSPFIIRSVITSPPCVLSGSLKVAKKCQSTFPGLGKKTRKLDAAVNGKLPYDIDSASIFSKAIDHKLSDGSRDDLYSRCRTNFANDNVKT